MTTDKALLRAKLRHVRDRFAAAPHPPIAISSAFRAHLSHGLTVASYVPIGSEADPSPLARAAMEAGCALALPHVTTRAAPIRFLAWETEAELALGPFGLRQPAESAAELRPDVILTPLIGFDRSLNRLGQGAGHYDCAFAAFPGAWRVGVAWSVQEVPMLPLDPWDAPLHAVATEQEWLTS